MVRLPLASRTTPGSCAKIVRAVSVLTFQIVATSCGV